MPSRTRPPRPPSRSRFQEGSMNDRTSAAPPVQFLVNDENTPPFASNNLKAYQIPRKPVPTSTIRAIPNDDVDEMEGVLRPREQQEKQTTTKKSSRILGQVWDGVFGMLSGKGSSNSAKSSGEGRKKTPSMMSTASTATANSTTSKARDSKEVKLDELRARLAQNDRERPSKEDVLQSYQELMASGFFSSHAIQSTRHSRPGTATNNSSSTNLNKNISTAADDQRPLSPPQWPLSTPKPVSRRQALHDHKPHALSPIPMTPGSAGSRGKKRAAAPDDDDDIASGNPPPQHGSGTKKLRKSASRDVSGAGAPRLRSVSSRRILGRRSFSSAPNNSSSDAQAPASSPQKLTKRHPPSSTMGRPCVRAPLPIPSRASSATLRHANDYAVPRASAEMAPADLDTRVLRPRRSAAEVRPDAGRGIPGVPAIPPEFTYGADREVGGPWRGLRR